MDDLPPSPYGNTDANAQAQPNNNNKRPNPRGRNRGNNNNQRGDSNGRGANAHRGESGSESSSGHRGGRGGGGRGQRGGGRGSESGHRGGGRGGNRGGGGGGGRGRGYRPKDPPTPSPSSPSTVESNSQPSEIPSDGHDTHTHTHHQRQHHPHHQHDNHRRHHAPRGDNIGGFGDNNESTLESHDEKRNIRSSSSNSNTNTNTNGKTSRTKRVVEELTKGHSEQTSRMITLLMNNTYECMVCVEKVGRKAAIWSCQSCYHVFHIGCITKWRKSSLADEIWKCPACRFSYKSIPEAKCFCGKQTHEELAANPFNPFVLAHSCGEICSKKRSGTNCPHSCALLCHPGPCPECAALAPPKKCYCGATVYQKRCGVPDDGVSCEGTCNRLLNCGKHRCTAVCHPGACSPCALKVDQKCYCGKETTPRICGSEKQIDSSNGPEDIRVYSCGSLCERTLACGNHVCQNICHPSLSAQAPQCKPCPLLPSELKFCPCGKTSLSQMKPLRKACTDPIPTCQQICNKLLNCEQHSCTRICHTGPCLLPGEECSRIVGIPCRCGNTRGFKELKCSEVYPNNFKEAIKDNICKKTCTILRDCGRHQCGVKCCPAAGDPSDPEGLHVCKIICNKPLPCGHHRCQNSCHKGRCNPCLEATFEDQVCPCGRTVHYAPITCGSKPPLCPGQCTVPRACGHPVTPHPCHWEGSCPDCVVLTERVCASGHGTVKSVPCYKTEVSCGRPCGKPMQCKAHLCTRPCHGGPCEVPVTEDLSLLAPEEQPNPDAGPSCGQRCKKQLTSCTHQCKAPCHPGRKCPTTCTQKSRISCSCFRLSEERPCVGLEDVKIPCDEVCRKEIRQRQLAEALGILPSTKPPQYSDLLMNMARAAPQFVTNLEQKLNHFIRIPDIRMRLESMDVIQRRVVHELCKYYYLDTESAGTEPSRQVQVMKKVGCRVPTVLLSQIAKFELAEAEAQYKQAMAQKHEVEVDEEETPGATASATTTTTTTGATIPRRTKAPSTLHIYDLSPTVKTYHLENLLRPFQGEYTLQWVDDANALAIFRHPALMRKALGSLSGGLFKVKAYQDANPHSGSQLVLGGKPGGPVAPPPLQEFQESTKVSKAQPLSDQPRPWDTDTNPFKALSSDTGMDDNLRNSASTNDPAWDTSRGSAEKEPTPTTTTPTETQPPRENWEDLLDGNTSDDGTAPEEKPPHSAVQKSPQDNTFNVAWDNIAADNEW